MKAITYFGTDLFFPLGAWPSPMPLALGRLTLQSTAVTKLIFTPKKTEIKRDKLWKRLCLKKMKRKPRCVRFSLFRRYLLWKVVFRIIASWRSSAKNNPYCQFMKVLGYYTEILIIIKKPSGWKTFLDTSKISNSSRNGKISTYSVGCFFLWTTSEDPWRQVGSAATCGTSYVW